jgi:tetratricopeptide (TPR) repeat protein
VGIVDGLAFVQTDNGSECAKVVHDCGIPSQTASIYFQRREDFDFSSARNKALNLAKSFVTNADTWLMWLDCDDTLSDPQAILKAFRRNRADAYAFPYDVGGAQDNIRKIRIHRPTGWHWVNKVHEELISSEPDKQKIIYDNTATIQHRPDDEKSNHDFHILLLMEGCKDAPNQYAYIGKEHFNRMEYDKALPWLLNAARLHDWPNEVYICWLYAGYIALNHLKDDAKAEKWLLRAVGSKPHRREAWYFLAQMCARQGGERLRDALSYVSCANAQIDEKEPMQHQHIYHRDAYLLHGELLIAAGLKAQAAMVLDKVSSDNRNDQWKALRDQVDSA